MQKYGGSVDFPWTIIGSGGKSCMPSRVIHTHLNALSHAVHCGLGAERYLFHLASILACCWFSERLAEVGVEVSVGSKGDAYDNAMAELVIGLFKTEVIRHAGPWRGLDDVEYATLEWVSWFNTTRLLGPLGYLPPAEYEAQFQRQFQELQAETISAGALK
jgi:hypothetical protein